MYRVVTKRTPAANVKMKLRPAVAGKARPGQLPGLWIDGEEGCP